MGTWDSGPFDNDTAADWCGDLDDADIAKRPALVREALTRAAGEDGYLDADIACEAIAAAAIVAAQQPGGQPITSPYAPDFLRDGGRLDLPDDLAVLAVEPSTGSWPRTPNGATCGRTPPGTSTRPSTPSTACAGS